MKPNKIWAYVLAALGAIILALELYVYSHYQLSILDEGAYVYKGYLFASGQYAPFEPYGPWTNHPPLAFLIPGYIQLWFGTGLKTARHFAIILVLFFALGLWILTRRLAGKWWAAAVLWILILNPNQVKLYGLATSQGLIACMLVWSMVFTIGENRKYWQLVLGGFIAGAMVMTRVNMLPVLGFLAIYVLWQHGWKAAIVSASSMLFLPVYYHIRFWPDILSVWIKFPRGWFPTIDQWLRLPAEYQREYVRDYSLDTRIASLFQTFQMTFLSMVGTLGAWILVPRRQDWSRDLSYRFFVVFSLLYLVMTFVHLGASIGRNYCVFCAPSYMAFFSFIGWLILAVSLFEWMKQPFLWRSVVIVILILSISTGIGFSLSEKFGELLLGLGIPRILLTGEADLGIVPIAAILQNKFGWSKSFLLRFLPSALGFIVGNFVLLLGYLVKGLVIQKIKTRGLGYRFSSYYFALMIFLVLGASINPLGFWTQPGRGLDCKADVIQSYESAGKRLSEIVKPDDQVYWMGTSVIPLLYIPDARSYPAQINGDYSFYAIGDTELLAPRGYWNRELADRWLRDADVVLEMSASWNENNKYLIQAFDRVEVIPLVVCNPKYDLRIYTRTVE